TPHACLHRHRMQAVHEQQVRHELVVRQLPGIGRRLDDPGQPLAVEAEERAHGLHALLTRLRIGQRLDFLEERLQPAYLLAVFHGGHECWAPNIGECTCLSVLPSPKYMCTPQGRHGSKLRTARMMSIPRKLSWSFSSKI